MLLQPRLSLLAAVLLSILPIRKFGEMIPFLGESAPKTCVDVGAFQHWGVVLILRAVSSSLPAKVGPPSAHENAFQ